MYLQRYDFLSIYFTYYIFKKLIFPYIAKKQYLCTRLKRQSPIFLQNQITHTKRKYGSNPKNRVRKNVEKKA